MMNNNVIGGYGIDVIPGFQNPVYLTGIVRFNQATQQFEVMGDSSWHPITQSSDTVRLNHDIIKLLDWVKEKQNEEIKIAALCEEYAGLKDLKEKYEIMLALVQNTTEDDK